MAYEKLKNFAIDESSVILSQLILVKNWRKIIFMHYFNLSFTCFRLFLVNIWGSVIFLWIIVLIAFCIVLGWWPIWSWEAMRRLDTTSWKLNGDLKKKEYFRWSKTSLNVVFVSFLLGECLPPGLSPLGKKNQTKQRQRSSSTTEISWPMFSLCGDRWLPVYFSQICTDVIKCRLWLFSFRCSENKSLY